MNEGEEAKEEVMNHQDFTKHETEIGKDVQTESNQHNSYTEILKNESNPQQNLEIIPSPTNQNQTINEEQILTPHKKVEKIVGMKVENDKKYFLVKYAGQKDLEVVDGAIIRKHNQKVLLNFYEENIKLIDVNAENDEIAFQALASKLK